MSTAGVFELLAANPADVDCFCTTSTDKETLEKACQWRCSLPRLELEDALIMQRSHVDTCVSSFQFFL